MKAETVVQRWMSSLKFSMPRRRLSQKVPFDLNEKDDKYSSFNNMYTDMFAPENKIVLPQSDQTSAAINELEEINQEMNDLYNVGFSKLTSLELEEVVKDEGRFILQSLSTNPYYNLAVEDYVFRHTPLNDRYVNQRLLFYRNDNCVVIGKNQTAWKEVFLSNLARKGYQFLRRLSGGGAVVHDLGNVNYSYITSRKEFNRELFNKLIIKWLTSSYPHLDLSLSARGDITLEGKKVSGSAFKIAKGKAYHHGTMLVNSNLENFKGLLKPDIIEGGTWNCNSVDSVRSPVTNIPLGVTQKFVDSCIRGFQGHFTSPNGTTDQVPVYYCDELVSINEDIQHTMSKLQSEEWKYFSGPDFIVNIPGTNDKLSVKKGIIMDSSNHEAIGLSFKQFAEDLSKNGSMIF